MSSGWAITVFVVGMIVAIMVHEWGHFWTARRFGMRADRFFLGFGPTLWSMRRGETEYGVKAIPAGGFVRIRGMAPTDERLRPVADAVLSTSALEEERRRAAERTGTEVEDQPTIPSTSWERLGRELGRRGTPRAMRKRILHRIERNLPADATASEARLTLTQILVSEAPATGRVGDLHHRLLQGDEGRFFGDRPAWQRAIVLSAGSAMHFVQAFVLLFVGFLLFGQTVATPQVNEVVAGTPAARAGLQADDVIIAVGGLETDDVERLRGAIEERAGQSTEVVVERDGDVVTLQATPEAVEDPDTGSTRGVLGFNWVGDSQPLPASEALYETFAGPTSVPALVGNTFTSIGRVFGPEGIGSIFAQVAGEEERDETGALSLVGVAQAAGSTSQLGPLFLFFLLASVNVFVGIFNLLPLPPLDGGHLAVLGVERGVNAVRARLGRERDFTIDPSAVAAIAVPVIVLVGVLSVALIWLDVVNPIDLVP